MRGDGGVVGEGIFVGAPNNPRGKCTMPLISTKTGCPTLPPACVFLCYIIFCGFFKLHLGSNYM